MGARSKVGRLSNENPYALVAYYDLKDNAFLSLAILKYNL